jgi:hypothetical protein
MAQVVNTINLAGLELLVLERTTRNEKYVISFKEKYESTD